MQYKNTTVKVANIYLFSILIIFKHCNTIVVLSLSFLEKEFPLKTQPWLLCVNELWLGSTLELSHNSSPGCLACVNELWLGGPQRSHNCCVPSFFGAIILGGFALPINLVLFTFDEGLNCLCHYYYFSSVFLLCSNIWEIYQTLYIFIC